jgi:drug/metabolite transporter (DMT)-like permease
LALVIVAALAFRAQVRLVFLRPRVLWMRSLAGSVSLVCTFFALTRLPVSEVLTLTNVFPVWIVLLSWPMYKEAPSVQIWLSVAGSVLGVALIQQPHFADGNYEVLVPLVSSFFTAIAMMGLHQLQDLDPRAIVVHFSGVSLFFCTAAFFSFERMPEFEHHVNPTALLVLIGVGVSAAIGQLFLTRAFAAGPPTKVAVVSLTQIVFALGFDLLFWGHSFDGLTLAGMALVIAPTAWIMLQRSI